MTLGAFAFTRLIIMLRRIWKSTDRLADIQQERLQLEHEMFRLDYPTYGQPPREVKKTAIGVVDVEDLNKGWNERKFRDG